MPTIRQLGVQVLGGGGGGSSCHRCCCTYMVSRKKKSVTTLTLGSRQNVKHRAYEAKSVFRCETHFHKLRRMQGMKPNDS